MKRPVSKETIERAYSVLQVRSVDESQRVIEGIATTPTPDRYGDIVDPMGAKYQLPMPLLWQHQASKPVGHVEFAAPNADGIPFKARVMKTDEPGAVKDRLDEAWQSVKMGLVRAVSIGFSPLKWEFMKEGGVQFNEWEWLELSLVTIPANSEATISQIRSVDTELRNSSGRAQSEPTRPDKSPTEKVKPMSKKTVAEQISAFEATRAAKSARMTEIMDAAAAEGKTLNPEQTAEYDGLAFDVKSVEDHLVRLRALEASQAASAKPVTGVVTQETGSQARAGVVQVRSQLPKGTAFTRFAIALARSKGNLMQAHEIAKGWHDSTPEVETVMKSAVAAGTTTDPVWAAPLVEYQVMASEFIELLRPLTIIGRIDGFRRVPFNVKMPSQTSGSSVNWVGQGKPKPVGDLAFDTTTLRWAKAAGIVVLTEELVRFSNPSAEAIVRQDLANAIAQFLDEQFVDPDIAEVSDVSPASITNGIVPVQASGVTAADLRADVKALFSAFLQANISPAGSVWVMPGTLAMAIGMLMNALGQPEFPGIGMNGGTFFGLPVITSESVKAQVLDTGASPDIPAGARMILVKPSEILLADDGGITIDVSREASLEMANPPSSPITNSTVLVSLWQNNMVGLRAERYINWKRRRAAAVGYINSANYGS